MSTTAPAKVTRPERYWIPFAVALFVLITVDMATTLYAAAHVGTAAEANPVMRWALDRGIAAVTAVNLAAAVLAVACFSRLVRSVESTPTPWRPYVELGVAAWLGLLIAAGIAVSANNVAVVVHGRSIVPL